jgi:hypothetical protein
MMHLTSTAGDVIREWKRTPFNGQCAPWQHESALVRALWAKQEMWLAMKTLEDIGPGPDYRIDGAVDVLFAAKDKHRSIITAAWEAWCLERGYVPSASASDHHSIAAE